MSILFKTLKWFFWTLLLLLILLFTTVAYFTATETGYRQLPKIISSLTPYHIEYRHLDGDFWSRQVWQDIRIHGPGIDMRADELILDNDSGFSPARIVLKQASLRGAQIDLAATDKAQHQSNIPETLPQITLPFVVDIHQMTLAQVQVKQAGQPLIDIRQAMLNATYNAGVLDAEVSLDSDVVNAELTAHVKTLDDYPLTVHANLIQHQSAQPQQRLDIEAQGSVLHPDLRVTAQGPAQGRAALTGVVDLAAKQLDVHLSWQDIELTNVIRHGEGQLVAKGPFDDIRLTLNGALAGQNIPSSRLTADAQVTPQKIEHLNLNLKTLGGSVDFAGAIEFVPLQWQGTLQVRDIDGQLYRKDLKLRLNADVLTQGQLGATTQQAILDIHRLEGNWQGQPLQGSGSVRYLDGVVDARHFLLNLAGNSLTADGALGRGSTLNIAVDAGKLGHLIPGLQGNISGQAVLGGQVDNPAIQGNLHWTDVVYHHAADKTMQLASKQGTLKVRGHTDALDMQADITASGSAFPESRLYGTAQLGNQRIGNINLHLNSGRSQALLTGHVALQPEVAWDVQLKGTDINPSRFVADYSGKIQLNLSSRGNLDTDGGIRADVVVHQLEGMLRGQPVQGQGTVNYDHGHIRADHFLMNIAGNRIDADGAFGAHSGEQLTLNLTADKLGALLPNFSGKIHGKAILSGALAKPQIDTRIDWQDVRYINRHDQSLLFASTRGNIQAQGVVDNLAVQTDITAQGNRIPQSRLHGRFRFSPAQIRDIALTLNSGAGRITLRGETDLRPDIHWHLAVEAAQFNPGRFVPQYRGEVNAKLTTQGTISSKGVLSADADVLSLSGTLNGQPLSGRGHVKIEDEALNVHDLTLALGSNRIQLQGGYHHGSLDVGFDVDARRLATLYPPVNGSLTAKGHVHGSVAQPQITLNASLDHLRYQKYQLAKARVQLDTSLQQGGNFNNRILLTGVNLAGQQWQAINLSTEGQFNRHRMSVTTQGGAYHLDLAASGGFTDLQRWAGQLTQLSASGEGMKWHLQKASALDISPQAVHIRHFCLVDGISDVCIDLQRERETLLAYRIGTLSPKSFAAFIPRTVRTAITVKGEGEVRIAANGAMSGSADIAMTPGNLTIAPSDAAPVSLTLRRGVIKAAFQGEQANLQSSIDFAKAGKIALQTKISHFAEPQLDGLLSVDVPNIGEFRYLLPMVSSLKGKINGSLRFVGAASHPTLGGEVNLSNGYVVIPRYATELKNIHLQLAAAKTGQIDIKGQVGTPKGALDIRGALALSPLRLKLKLNGKEMLLANAEDMRVVVTPTFDVNIDPDKGINVDGKILIPQAKISIPDTSSGVAISKDVVIVGRQKKSVQEKLKQAQTPLNATIKVALGNKVFFDNSQVKIRLIGGITVYLRPQQPITAQGTISVASGVYELYGQELNIQRGRVTFSGGNIANPSIDVLALREVENVKVGAQITGDVAQLRLKLTSTPVMPDSAILSYLLFGRAPDAGMNTDALLQTAASATLGSVFGGRLSEKTGLDVLDIGISGLKAGKYLGDDLYVGMQSNFFNAITEFIARYRFSKRLKAEATVGPQNKAVDFIYEFESN